MKSFFKKYQISILAGLIFVAMSILNYVNEGTRGGGDSYMHYLFARWSFVHPHLFFDHWGKPLFTTLSAPFAQLGFKASVTFNIILTICSGVLVAHSAKLLGLKNWILGLILTVFTPMFFLISFSSLTEILFAFVLILSVYLMIKKQYLWSAVVISFIPFARTEGVIFLPLFALTLVLLKQYKYILFLATGFAVMSILGYPIYDDLLWVINKNPYHDTSALYGSGDLLHFVNHGSAIFGWPLLIAFALGTGIVARSIYKEPKSVQNKIYLLVWLCAMGYFMAHSVVWGFGMGGSAGLTRVMAGIIPVAALIGMLGIEFIIKITSFKGTKRMVLLSVLAIILILEGLTKTAFPLKLGQEEPVMIAACNFIKENKLDEEYIVYYSPFEAFTLGLDHFTRENSSDRVMNPAYPSSDLPDGTIIIWDAHYAPNEGGLPLWNLQNDSQLVFVKQFKPEHAFQSYAGQEYQIQIFQKSASKDE